jgi:hypothetical protein
MHWPRDFAQKTHDTGWSSINYYGISKMIKLWGNLKNTCFFQDFNNTWSFRISITPVTLQSTETSFTISPHLWLKLTITRFKFHCITITLVDFTKTPFVAGSAIAPQQLGTWYSRSLQKWRIDEWCNSATIDGFIRKPSILLLHSVFKCIKVVHW